MEKVKQTKDNIFGVVDDIFIIFFYLFYFCQCVLTSNFARIQIHFILSHTHIYIHIPSHMEVNNGNESDNIEKN